MNKMLTTAAAIANAVPVIYYCAKQFGVLKDETKADEDETKVELPPDNQFADVGIQPFDGSGYEIWSNMMKNVFLSQDLWDLVEGGYTEEELTIEALRDVRKKDAVALLFIQQAIDKSVFSCIANASKSKQAWDALQKKYPCNAEELDQKNSVVESDLSLTTDITESKHVSDALKQGYQAIPEVVEASKNGEEFGHSDNICDFNKGRSRNSYNVGGRFKLNNCDDNTSTESPSHSKLKASEDRIGTEFGDIKSNSCGSKKGSRGNSHRGGHDGEPLNNNWGGRGGRGRGHFNNKNRGGHGGIKNARFNNNQGGRGGVDEGEGYNNNEGGHGGIDSVYFNINNYSEIGNNSSRNPKFESTSCSAKAIKSKEVSDAPQQGHQANIEVQVQPHARDPNGEANQSFTLLYVSDLDVNVTDQTKPKSSHRSIFIKNLDKAVDETLLRNIFSTFGNIVSCKLVTNASGQPKGHGYIEYDNEEAAKKTVEKLNGMLLNDKRVYVGPLVIKREREMANKEETKFTNVFVGNLSESTTEEKLREVFGCFGTIVKVVVMRDEDGKSKGFGFVNFKDADDAAWSMEVLNGHKCDNKEWYVRRAYPKKKSVERAKKKSVERAKKKSVDESVPSSTANATELKKAGDAVYKRYRANNNVIYMDDKGIGHFKLKST